MPAHPHLKFVDTIPQVGCVRWIGLRPARKVEMNVVSSAEIDDQGLVGDFFTGAKDAPRAVTLIQAEHLPVVESILNRPVSPDLLRRNIVVEGINLKSLKDRRFRIGTAILYGTGKCAPCKLMEAQLGAGGYNAMRGHGGLTARVIQPGRVNVGDEVKVVFDQFDPED